VILKFKPLCLLAPFAHPLHDLSHNCFFWYSQCFYFVVSSTEVFLSSSWTNITRCCQTAVKHLVMYLLDQKPKLTSHTWGKGVEEISKPIFLHTRSSLVKASCTKTHFFYENSKNENRRRKVGILDIIQNWKHYLFLGTIFRICAITI